MKISAKKLLSQTWRFCCRTVKSVPTRSGSNCILFSFNKTTPAEKLHLTAIHLVGKQTCVPAKRAPQKPTHGCMLTLGRERALLSLPLFSGKPQHSHREAFFNAYFSVKECPNEVGPFWKLAPNFKTNVTNLWKLSRLSSRKWIWSTYSSILSIKVLNAKRILSTPPFKIVGNVILNK